MTVNEFKGGGKGELGVFELDGGEGSDREEAGDSVFKEKEEEEEAKLEGEEADGGGDRRRG